MKFVEVLDFYLIRWDPFLANLAKYLNKKHQNEQKGRNYGSCQ